MTEPRLDRLWPDPAFDVGLDDALGDYRAPAPVGDRPGVAINMVTSVDGRAQRDGTAEGLGSRADRLLMRRYRAAFDAVASGAGTLRASGIWLRVGDALEARRVADGLPPNPIGVLLAGSDPIPTDAKWFQGDEPRIVIAGSDSPIASLPPGTELLRAPDPLPRPGWVLDTLAGRGVRNVLIEGGPHVNAAFFAEGLVDELYWTVGAQILGSDALTMVVPFAAADAEPIPLRLISVMRHQDELLLRYAVIPG